LPDHFAAQFLTGCPEAVIYADMSPASFERPALCGAVRGAEGAALNLTSMDCPSF